MAVCLLVGAGQSMQVVCWAWVLLCSVQIQACKLLMLLGSAALCWTRQQCTASNTQLGLCWFCKIQNLNPLWSMAVGCCVTSLHILVCWWVVDVSKEVCLQVLCNLVTVTARCAGGEGGWILKCRAWGVISNADVLLLSYNTLAF